MKRFLALALFAAVTLAMAPAETQAKDHRLAGDLGLVMPLGDWGDTAGFGVGPMLRYEYLMSPQLSLTGRIGFIYHMMKETKSVEYSSTEIPILVGARYFFKGYTSKKREGLYAGGELGFFMMKTKGEGAGYSDDNDRNRIGLTVGAGYELGDIDFNLSLLLPNLLLTEDTKDAMGESVSEKMNLGIMFTVGYSFFAF